jgi:5-methylcytosine-specific restriction endonuclease McrA
MKTWTDSRVKSFIISALRGARWPAKFQCIEKSFVANGINPKTGRKCKLHRCTKCKQTFPKGHIQADHINPVVGPKGFVSWDVYIERMFCGPEGFQAICKACHADKTLMERYRISEETLEAHKKLIAFKKLKVAAQTKKLSQLKLKPETSAAKRIEQYRAHLKI